MKKSILKLAVIALLLGLAVLGYFQAPAFHEKREVTRRTTKAVFETVFEYEITANRDSTLWSEGEVMSVGMPLYFYALDPDVSVSTTLKADKPTSGEVTMTVNLVSVDSSGKAYWSKPMYNRNINVSLNNSETLNTYKFKVLEIRQQADEISRELDFRRGNQQVLITLQAELGEGSITHEIVFLLDNHGLVPPSNNQLTAIKEVTEEYTEKIVETRSLIDFLQQSYFWIYAGAIIVLVAIAFFAFRAEQASEYEKYGNWVARVRLTGVKEPDAYFESLKELIDAAVEMDKKVIFDPVQNTYYILDGDTVYAHRRKTR